MLQFPGSGSSGSFAGAGSGLLSPDMFFGVDSFFFPLFWGVFLFLECNHWVTRQKNQTNQNIFHCKSVFLCFQI